MSNHHYNKKIIKMTFKKKYNNVIPLLIKLNIIKYTILKENVIIIFLQTNKLTKIIKFSKPSESIFLNSNELKKLNAKTNCIFLISTNLGIISNKEALAKNIGGKLLFGVMQ